MIKFHKYLFSIILLLLSSEYYSQELKLFIRQSFDDEYKIALTKSFVNKSKIEKYLENYNLEDYSKSYFSAGFDSIVCDSLNNVEAYYSKGLKYSWDKIDFFSDTQKHRYKSLSTKKLTPEKLKLSFQKILIDNANSGYPFASIKFDTIQIEEDGKITGIINVENNNKIIFNSILIKGETKIKQYYLENYLNIRKGNQFSLQKVNDIDRKIKNLSFLEETKPCEIAFGDSIADILIYTKNKKANQFSGIVGIAPNNSDNEKLLITGDVNLYLINSIGYGELFSFNWKKYESLSQMLNLETSFPYLFKTDYGVAAKFDIDKRDSSFLNTDFTGKILYGNNIGTGIDVYYRNIKSIVLVKSTETLTANFSNLTTSLFGINCLFSKLDNLFNPRRGLSVLLNFGFGTNNYEEKEEENISSKSLFQNRSSIDFQIFFPIENTMALRLRNITSMIYSKKIFDNELDMIGGFKTIRGFEEKSLPTTSYSVVNLEYKYLFEESSNLFLFYDIGYFEKRFTANDSYNYAMGMGFGMDLKTAAGIFSLVFAVGKQNQNPFQFNNIKIHFGYKNYF